MEIVSRELLLEVPAQQLQLSVRQSGSTVRNGHPLGVLVLGLTRQTHHGKQGETHLRCQTLLPEGQEELVGAG